MSSAILDVINNKSNGIIVCGDSLNVMSHMPTGVFGLIFTSPPYNLRNSTGGWVKDSRGSKWASSSLREEGYGSFDDNMPHDEYVKWQRDCLSEMMRLLSDDGAIFYNHKWRVQAGLIQDRQDIVSGFPVRQIIIWKRKGGINFNDGYFLPTYEVIYLIAKKKFKLAPKANAFGDVWEIAQDRNNPHPASFPVDLANRVVSSTTSNMVLDPFAGSGTTALAAIKNKRRFVCIDKSENFCNMAAQRVADQNSFGYDSIPLINYESVSL